MACGLVSKPGVKASGVPVLSTATGVEPVVSIERIADDSHQSGLAIELMALEQLAGRVRRRQIERSLIEEPESPVGAVLQVEIQKIEIRERRHGIERCDEA